MSVNRPSSAPSVGFSVSEYDEFRAFLLQACGIDLGAGKEYLVATRVRRILAKEHIASVSQLLALLRDPLHRTLRQEVVDAMTTNETLWFRDAYPFDYLSSELLPSFASRSRGAVKVWSAACSSGQEPYSISMVVDEFNRSRFGKLPVNVQITATDISSAVLARAKQGLYDRLSIARGLSQERLQSFFSATADGHWQVKPALQQCIDFRTLNLQSDTFGRDKYDLVLCRNVLIYFNADLKARILRKIHEALLPGSMLFLGASESVSGAEDLFEVVNCRPGIAYRKR